MQSDINSKFSKIIAYFHTQQAISLNSDSGSTSGVYKGLFRIVEIWPQPNRMLAAH